mgnify:FL=1
MNADKWIDFYERMNEPKSLEFKDEWMNLQDEEIFFNYAEEYKKDFNEGRDFEIFDYRRHLNKDFKGFVEINPSYAFYFIDNFGLFGNFAYFDQAKLKYLQNEGKDFTKSQFYVEDGFSLNRFYQNSIEDLFPKGFDQDFMNNPLITNKMESPPLVKVSRSFCKKQEDNLLFKLNQHFPEQFNLILRGGYHTGNVLFLEVDSRENLEDFYKFGFIKNNLDSLKDLNKLLEIAGDWKINPTSYVWISGWFDEGNGILSSEKREELGKISFREGLEKILGK